MITDEKYERILDAGLTLDHYLLLCNIKNGVKLVENKRMQGFINLLTKKEYIKDDALTEKGLDIVENCQFSEIVNVGDKAVKINLADWIVGLHQRMEAKMVILTGKKQARGRVGAKYYPFLANATDLAKNINKVVTLYKLKDYDKIEKTLMKHIEDCHSANHWFPLMQYYILKEGKSQLVTDMDTIDDQPDSKEQFEQVNTKDLF